MNGINGRKRDSTYRFINRSCIPPLAFSSFPLSFSIFSIFSITLPPTRDSASCDLDRIWARFPPFLEGEGEGALALSLSWLVTRITGIGSSRLAIEKLLSSMPRS
jgi:hypothetical protein